MSTAVLGAATEDEVPMAKGAGSVMVFWMLRGGGSWISNRDDKVVDV